MLSKVSYIFCIILVFGFTQSAWTQEETDIGNVYERYRSQLDAAPVDLKGILSSSIRTNHISGIERRYDPFTWRLHSRLLLSTYGVKTSISINLSSSNKIYSLNLPDATLPSFRRIGISPRYKWAKFHLGYRSMNFSQYTLAGHSFLGGGMELTPGKWEFSAMYGKLNRAVEEDLDKLQDFEPTYRRMGWGLKAGYRNGQDHLALILFSAKDDPLSISRPFELNSISPAANTIISLVGRKSINNLITLDIDYALSAFTRDVESEEIDAQEGINIIEKMGGLFTPRVSSGYFKALHTELGIKTNFGKITLGHERVDPGYRTMGALYFNNDFENITLGSNAIFFDKKINLFGKLGYQRNNIGNSEINSLSRIIGMVNLKYKISERLNTGVSYSNFRTTNKLRASTIPIIQLDSLILSLVNQSASANLLYISGAEKNSVFTGFVTYQKSNSIENDEVQEDQSNRNIMINLGYNYTFLPSKTTINAGFMINNNHSFFNAVNTLSPSIGIAKPFYEEKLQIKSSISYIRVTLDGEYFNTMIKPTIGISLKNTNHHNFNFYSSYLIQKNNKSLPNGREFNQWISRAEYKFSF